MPYVTSVEEIGFEKGYRQGFEEGYRQGFEEGYRQGLIEMLPRVIELGLELKFGAAGVALLPDIQRLNDLATLEAIYAAIRTAGSPEDIRRIYHIYQPWQPPEDVHGVST